ncbi:hypothetical protein [Trichlorobacter lovleyi]|uniref:hypothetical protein n=1 Tax=Trichlorobacter lovleyi TaxID=313985 RepID=UPI0023F20661|nr:hypothetical protein [Trichlorobacter lovleyi]
MNYLQRYIELRKTSCQEISNAVGLGYHSVQKVVKGVRRPLIVRKAVAEYLGLDPVKTWGRGAAMYLRHMIAVEANRMADEKAEQARAEFLAKYGASSNNLTAKRQAVNV